MMPFSAINAPNLVTGSLNLNNSDLILPQIPRNPQLPQTDISTLVAHRQYDRYRDLPMDVHILSFQMAISTLLSHRQYDRYQALPMDRPGDPAQ